MGLSPGTSGTGWWRRTAKSCRGCSASTCRWSWSRGLTRRRRPAGTRCPHVRWTLAARLILSEMPKEKYFSMKDPSFTEISFLSNCKPANQIDRTVWSSKFVHLFRTYITPLPYTNSQHTCGQSALVMLSVNRKFVELGSYLFPALNYFSSVSGRPSKIWLHSMVCAQYLRLFEGKLDSNPWPMTFVSSFDHCAIIKDNNFPFTSKMPNCAKLTKTFYSPFIFLRFEPQHFC